MKKKQLIMCIGEVLWDALPSGLFLGGAPLNVCMHLHELGEQVAMVSRVGKDRLGDEAIKRIKLKGVSAEYIQRDDQYETGFVEVHLGHKDTPDYDIIQPAAWDFIHIEQPKVQKLMHSSWAVVFGSLAQRSNSSLKRLVDLDCLKVLDMNLRPPHYKEEVVKFLVKNSDIIKMNEDELETLQTWFGLDEDLQKSIRELASFCGCRTVCVTRGEYGSALLHDGKYFEHPGYSIEVVDTVGAGDAFLSALLHCLRTGKAEDEILPFANTVGAYVASQAGANPSYSISEIESIISS